MRAARIDESSCWLTEIEEIGIGRTPFWSSVAMIRGSWPLASDTTSPAAA